MLIIDKYFFQNHAKPSNHASCKKRIDRSIFNNDILMDRIYKLHQIIAETYNLEKVIEIEKYDTKSQQQ